MSSRSNHAQRRRTVSALVAVLVAGSVIGLGGCGLLQSQQQRAQAEAKAKAADRLDAAQALFDKANRGYSDPAAEGEQPQPLAEFRTETLAEAREDLQWVIDSAAPLYQKQQARQLLAEIHAIRAGHAASQAAAAMRALDPLKADLQAQLARARSAKVRAGEVEAPAQADEQEESGGIAPPPITPGGKGQAGGLDQGDEQGQDNANDAAGQQSGSAETENEEGQDAGDVGQSLAEQLFVGGDESDSDGDSPAAGGATADIPAPAGSRQAQVQRIIEKLKTGPDQPPQGLGNLGLESKQQLQTQLAGEIESLQQQIEQKQQRVSTLEAKAKQQFARTQELRNEAFGAEGERHFELLAEANEAQTAGREASFKAQQLKAEIEASQRELSDLNQQRQLASQAADRLREAIAKYQQRAKQIQQQQRDAAQQVSEARQAVGQTLGQLRDRYQAVAKQYNTAASRIAKAVEVMKAAADAAEGDQQNRVQYALLSQYVEQARILSEHAQLARGLASSLKTASGADVLGQAQVAAMNEAISNLTESHEQLTSKLNKAVDSGRELAQTLADAADEDLAELANKQSQRLQSYRGIAAGNVAAAE